MKLNKKSEIAFTKDILKEVSDNLDIDIESVRSVYTSMMSHIKFLTRKTNCVALFIPHLGTLHIRLQYVLSKLSTSKRKEDKETLSIYESKKELLNKHLDGVIEHEQVKVSRHLQKDKSTLTLYNSGCTMEEIENKQNSIE